MSKTILKLFLDHDKEEKWLNEMCGKGLALVNYSFGKYIFEKCDPNQYTFRVDFFNPYQVNNKKRDYIKFIEVCQIEYIATSYTSWLYFRKENIYGDFDIYSNVDSKLKYYKKINTVFAIGIIFSFFGLITKLNDLLNFKAPFSTKYYVILLGVVAFFIQGLLFFLISFFYTKKINILKKEKDILE